MLVFGVLFGICILFLEICNVFGFPLKNNAPQSFHKVEIQGLKQTIFLSTRFDYLLIPKIYNVLCTIRANCTENRVVHLSKFLNQL